MTVIRMVEAGNGIGMISNYTLDSVSHSLSTFEILPEIQIDIGIEAISLNDLLPTAKAFIPLLRKINLQ